MGGISLIAVHASVTCTYWLPAEIFLSLEMSLPYRLLSLSKLMNTYSTSLISHHITDTCSFLLPSRVSPAKIHGSFTDFAVVSYKTDLDASTPYAEVPVNLDSKRLHASLISPVPAVGAGLDRRVVFPALGLRCFLPALWHSSAVKERLL